MNKKILVSLVILLASLMSVDVFAYYDNNDSYIYVEKVGDGGYVSGRDGVQSFASTQDIILTAGGNNISDDVSVDVYDAHMDNILDYLVYRGEGEQVNSDISMDDRNPIATMNVNLGDEFTLPVNGTGVWLVRVRAGDEEILMYVIRSSYGTVVKEEKEGLLLWVQDFNTKRSKVDVPITVYSLRDEIKEHTQTKTDNEGIAHTDTSAKYDVIIVGEGKDKALIPLNLEYLNIEYKSDSNKYKGQQERIKNFIFTDRPLYKPGDTVYFKVISRADDDFAYRVAQGKWKAQIVTGWGDSLEVVDQGNYDIDSYGTIVGELKLPENIKTGQIYRLKISNDEYDGSDSFYGWFNNNYSVDLQVEYYRKPEYELNVAVANHESISGENISFSIDGKYFSGEALTNAQIEYSVTSNNFWDPVYEDGLMNTKDYRYGYGFGADVTKGVTTLDANGFAQVSIPTAISDGKSKIYTVEVTYTPQTGEQVIDSENALVYAGEYGIYRTDYQHLFSVNKEASVDIVLHKNRENANVNNQQLTVEGKRIWWEVEDINKRYLQYNRKEQVLPQSVITTDSEGKTTFRFTPTDTGSYKFVVNGVDQFGNSIKKDLHVWVSDRDAFVPEQNNGLAIILDKEKYEPGDTVRMSIASKSLNRDVLLDIERDFVHRFQVVHIDGNSSVVDIDLEDADIPNMHISVNSFSDNRLDTVGSSIKIATQSKELDIDIITDKEVYLPGDTIKVDVVTKDHKGNPQEADVALWAVDKSLFELVPQNNHDIHDLYWDYRHGYTSMTNSLRGIWIQISEGGGCFLPGTQVLMDDGKTKNIENIQKGDKVLTFDDEQKKLVSASVTKTHTAIVSGYLTINNTLRVTGNHIVWVNDTWKSADAIRIGDRMRDKYNQEIIVESISWQGGAERVYNLIVEGLHTYIADGYFVHNGKGGGGIMRTLFKDMAYWNPRVRTGSDGKAQISFSLPDNLTTWVFAAIGATKETIVGNVTKEIRTTKAAIIRPQLPNILRKGDKTTLVASAHNNTSKDRTFIVTLKLDKGEVNSSEQEIDIPAGESRVVVWSVLAEYTDESIGFTYSLVASDDEKINDSVYKEVPIEQFGFWDSDSVAHAGVESYSVQIDEDARNDKTKVELTIASNVTSSLTGSMNYLIHYPYGCMEQTTSAFMPAVLAKENPVFFANAMNGKDIDDIIRIGISRLTDKQSSDGGWSWWGGESDVFLSTYIVEYLLRSQAIGATVDENVLNRARDYFDTKKSEDYDEVIINSYGQSLFYESDARQIRQNIAVTSEMDSDIVAMAVIANIRNGHTDQNTNGYSVLVAQLQDYGNVSYWPAGSKERFSSNDASSGIALRAFLVAGGDVETAGRVMRHFLSSRQKEYWTSTFATAQILEGFTQYAKLEQEKSQNYTTQIFVDDTLLTTQIFNSDNTVEIVQIPVDMIDKSGSIISIKPNNQNVTLYSTLLTREYHTNTEAQPVSRTISLERSYENAKGENYSIGIGDTVIVDFSVSGLKKEDRYFMIEDQLPAGMVPLNEHLDNVSKKNTINDEYNYGQKEYTKNGVIISDNYIDSGGEQHYQYRARVVSGGDYGVPPAQAMLMYMPEIYAHSGSRMIHIDNESQVVNIDGSEVGISNKKGVLFGNTSFQIITIAIIGLITIGAFVTIWLFRRKS